MKQTVFSALLFLCLCAAALPAMAQKVTKPETLCAPDELVIFSCPTSKDKLISLCADADRSTLQYRYARVLEEVKQSRDSGLREHKIIRDDLLIFPTERRDSLNAFTYNHYMRYQVDYTRIGFRMGGADYEVFHDVDSENADMAIDSAGLNKEDILELQCEGPVTDNMSTMASVLTCNVESALGCPEKPKD